MHVDFQGNSRPSLLFQLFIVDLYNIVNIFSLDTNKQTDNCKVNIDLTIAETEFKEFESPLNFGRFKSRLNYSSNSDTGRLSTFSTFSIFTAIKQ